MMANIGPTTYDTSTMRLVFHEYTTDHTTVLLCSPNTPLNEVQRRVDALFRPTGPTPRAAFSEAAQRAERSRERMRRFLAERVPADSAHPKPARDALRVRSAHHWMVHRERCHTRSGRRIPAKTSIRP